MTFRLPLCAAAFVLGILLASLTLLPGLGPVFAQGEDSSLESKVSNPPVEVLWEFTSPPGERTPYILGYRAWVLSHGNRVFSSRVLGGMYALDADSGELAWSYDANAYISPAAADGVLHIGQWDGRLVTLDAESGQELWSFESEGAGLVRPTAFDGVVYAGVGGNLQDMDAATGEIWWVHQAVGTVISAPVIAGGIVLFASVDGPLYQSSSDHWVHALDAGNGELLWSFSTGDPIVSAPAVADGVAYVVSDGRQLYALDIADGQELWSFDTKDIGSTALDSSPVVRGGVAYFASNDNGVYAVNTEDGTLRWRVEIAGIGYQRGDPAFSSPMVNDGVLYIGSANGHLYAMDALTGVSLWGYDTGVFSASTPSLGGEVVYVSNIGNRVFALDTSAPTFAVDQFAGVRVPDAAPGEAGSFLWKRYLGSGGAKTVIADDIVYASNYNRLLALDASTGRDLWWRSNGGLTGWLYAWVVVSDGAAYMPTAFNRMSALDGATGDIIWDYRTEGRTFVSPIVADGAAYFGSNGTYVIPRVPPYLNSVDSATGELRWRTVVGYRGLQRVFPKEHSGIAYFGTDSGHMQARDVTTGALIWEFRAGDRVQSHPEIADGVVYFTSWDRHLYALDALSGDLLWRFSDGRHGLTWPVVNDGIAYVSTRLNLYALDASTGKVLWQQPFLEDSVGGVEVRLSQDVVYVSTSFSGVMVMDAKTGELLWEYVLENDISTSISDLVVTPWASYLVSEDSRLLIFDTRSGELQAVVGNGSPGWTHNFVIENEVVYIRSHDGHLYALESPIIPRNWYLLGI